MPRGRRAQQAPQESGFTPRPALTPEDRENQVISAAYDLAEKQIREGTASAMVITHFLKLGSQRERLERELLSERTSLAHAKTASIDQERTRDDAYRKVIRAMKKYNGYGEPGDEDDGDDYADVF